MFNHKFVGKIFLLMVLLLAILATQAFAQNSDESLDVKYVKSGKDTVEVATKDKKEIETFLDMSLAELLDLEISTVSKKTEKISEAPAIVTTISKDQIYQYGVETCPIQTNYSHTQSSERGPYRPVVVGFFPARFARNQTCRHDPRDCEPGQPRALYSWLPEGSHNSPDSHPYTENRFHQKRRPLRAF